LFIHGIWERGGMILSITTPITGELSMELFFPCALIIVLFTFSLNG